MLKQPISVETQLIEAFSAGVVAAKGLRKSLTTAALAQRTEAEFQHLAQIVEALPLTVDRGHICFLRNWVASARKLWKADETAAARYQLQQVERVLDRIRSAIE